MATRSRIGIITETEVKSVYCHWDGYPSNNGRILLEYYNDRKKVEDLVNLGDISSLNNSIEKPDGHSFSTPVEGYTVFYHRDRGEDWESTKPLIMETKTKLGKKLSKEAGLFSEEYAYLFDCKTNKWKYWSCRKDNRWRLLTQKVVKEK